MENTEKYYEESLDLDYENKELWEKNLAVLKDGDTPVDMSYSDLFDGFESIKAVTYSSSPKFFDEMSKGYKKAEIILGLPTADFKGGLKALFRQAFKTRKNDFRNVNESTRQMIANDLLKVRYGVKHLAIHDKFYILSKEGLTRVIFGSANMSKQAFNENINQAETVSYFDNHAEIIDFFEKRFKYYVDNTVDYFPKNQIRHYKEYGMLLPIKENHENDEDLDTILAMPAEVISELAGELAESGDGQEDNEYYLNILNKSISKKKSGIVKKERSKIQEVISKAKKPHNVEEDAQSIENRTLILNNLDNPYFYQSKTESFHLESFEYTKEDLIKGLRNIDDWINTYKSFERYTPEIGTRVMEVIMSSFNAVFAKEIRDQIATDRRKEEITRIPVVYFLAGQANSGKSSLLSYIAKLLGVESPVEFSKLNKQKKGRVHSIIDSAFESGNKMPMLIDEYDNKQLSNSSSGLNQSIKGWCNNLNTIPCLITSTNLEDFSMPEEIRRRTKFFMMTNIFNSEQTNDIDYAEVIENADNTLFKIFASKFITGMENAKMYQINKFNTDYLSLTREIFKELYEEAGMEEPEYVSDTVADDYDLVAKRTWKMLVDNNHDDFRHSVNDEGKPTLILPAFILQQYNGVKDNNVQIYKNFLPNRCLDSEINSNLSIVLLEEPFIEWLGYNPFEEPVVEEKKGLFSKFRGK